MKMFKLAFVNVKKSYRDFSIYFMTISVGICIFYIFNSLEAQSSMLELTESLIENIASMSQIMAVFSAFVSLVLGFLILFANAFLIKRRKKEYAIYLTLGMEKSKVAFVSVLETLYIGFLSLIMGLISGVLLSQFMGIITANLFGIKMANFTVVFSFEAMMKTIVYFAMIFMVAMIFNTLNISKLSLIALLNAHRENGYLKERPLIVSIIQFCLSLVILGYSYYIAVTMDVLDAINPISIVGGTVGSYLFYYSVAGFAFKIIQKNEKRYFKDLNIFVFRQLHTRMGKTVISTTVISILLFLTLSALASTTSLVDIFSDDIENQNTYDVSLVTYSATKNDDIEQLLRENSVFEHFESFGTITLYESNYSINHLFDQVGDYTFKANLISLSEFNAYRDFKGQDSIHLDKDQYYAISDVEELKDNWTIFLQDGEVIIDEQILQPVSKIIDESVLYNFTFNLNPGTLVVHDELIDNGDFEPEAVIVNGLYIGNHEMANKGVHEKIEKYNIDVNNPYVIMNSKIDYIAESMVLRMTLVYVGIYLGLIFLLASSTIIALIQLSESEDNILRYSLLYKLGTSEKLIRRSILKSVSLAFIAPAFLAGIDSIFGIWIVNNIVMRFEHMSIIKNVIYGSLVIVLVYGGYFLLTYQSVKKNIFRKLHWS